MTDYEFEVKIENPPIEEQSGFNISKFDLELIDAWHKTHDCDYVNDPCKIGAIGGRISYQFTPTGLGNILVVKCACGDKLDLTNSDNW